MATARKPASKPTRLPIKKPSKPTPRPRAKALAPSHTTRPQASGRPNLDIPNLQPWADQLATFAQKNPSAMLVGAMAVLLAFLLLWP